MRNDKCQIWLKGWTSNQRRTSSCEGDLYRTEEYWDFYPTCKLEAPADRLAALGLVGGVHLF